MTTLFSLVLRLQRSRGRLARGERSARTPGTRESNQSAPAGAVGLYPPIDGIPHLSFRPCQGGVIKRRVLIQGFAPDAHPWLISRALPGRQYDHNPTPRCE